MPEIRPFDGSGYTDSPPDFVTAPEHVEVLKELSRREPLFHRPEFGRTRQDFANMTADEFWEIGASGRRYSRDYVLHEVARRYENPQYQGVNSPPEDGWVTKDFYCVEIAADNFLLTYTLLQGQRVTRRSTIWRRCGQHWKALFHQGTIVNP